MDRKRVGKTLSNKDWQSQVDPEAKIAKMKDGRTYLAYKPEHAVDPDTGAVVAVEVHDADKGDTSTLKRRWKPLRKACDESLPHRHARTILRNWSRTRAISPGVSSRTWTVGRGGQESPNPSAKGCTIGRATTRPHPPCTTTELGYRRWSGRPWENSERKWSRGVSSTPWTGAVACAGFGTEGGEHPEALCPPRRRFQSRPANAAQDWPWHPEGPTPTLR